MKTHHSGTCCEHGEHHHHGTHGHHHHHHHHHVPQSGAKLLLITLLNALITVAEVVGGLLSNSLSLLSDAVHNLGDTLAIAFAYVARRIGNKRADMRHTFGYKRAEILAAFVNAAVLLAICLFLLKEAYERWQNPEPIKGKLMLIVAIIGLVANLLSVLLLQKEKEHNMNTRAAYLHLLGDTLSSVAVIAGGIAIWLYDLVWLDPLITALVSLYIMYHTWGVLREAVDILMQTAPADVDIPHIVGEIETIPDVCNVHHLHLWRLNEEQTHFEAHIKVADGTDMERVSEIRKEIQTLLQEHHICHCTLQVACNCCENDTPLIVDESPD